MRAALTVVLLVLILASHGSAQQGGTIPVLAAPVGWTANGKPIPATLKSSDELVARGPGELQLSCALPGPAVLVYSCRAQTCRAKACATTGEGMEIRRLAPISEVGTLVRISEWWSSLMSRQPVVPVIAAARTGDNPSDAVVLHDGRGVHWGPALTRVLEGKVCFRLTSLPERPSNRAMTITLDWDRAVDAEGAAPAPNVAAGLYAFEKGHFAANGNCDRDPEATPAWVLIAQRADFERLSAEWKQQRASIDELDRVGVSPAALTSVRRAGLAHLARSFPPQ